MTEQTTNPKERATLYKKIAAVTAEVSRIPKNGKNAFHNYKYATESDITDGLRALLQEHGLAFLPPSVLAWERDETVDNPKQGPRTRVQVQFALGCTDTGETFTAVLWGEGQDASDKGFYKAYTGAVKYFLMKTFLIATGDDPEQDTQQRQNGREASYQAPRTNGATAGPKMPDGWTLHTDSATKQLYGWNESTKEATEAYTHADAVIAAIRSGAIAVVTEA